MNSSGVATRYAQALYKLAPAKESLKNALIEAVSLIESDPRVRGLLLAPQISKPDKEKILREIFKATDPRLLNFLCFLLRHGRIQYLGQIASVYKRLILKETEELQVKMITAVPIDDALKKQVADKLEKAYAKKILIQTEVDERIIGGMILIFANQMLDGSILHHLIRLKESLLAKGS